MHSQGKPRASEFVFARLRYESGDWDYNPKVAANILNSIVEYTNIRVYPQEVVIAASSEELLSFPFLFMTGHKLVRFSRKERERLQEFVDQGGFLLGRLQPRRQRPVRPQLRGRNEGHLPDGRRDAQAATRA
jgi:hypothetical protein